jgi:hypothetical protein
MAAEVTEVTEVTEAGAGAIKGLLRGEQAAFDFTATGAV